MPVELGPWPEHIDLSRAHLIYHPPARRLQAVEQVQLYGVIDDDEAVVEIGRFEIGHCGFLLSGL